MQLLNGFRHKCLACLPILLGAFLFAATLPGLSACADEKLPPPLKAGGRGIFGLIENRASGPRGNFPTKPISDEELSTILWATTGLNRNGSGWTIPLAKGREPYVRVYVLRKQGTFRYNWLEHSLVEISKENALHQITSDNFVRAAPIVLALVADGEKMAAFSQHESGLHFDYVAAGAMTEHTYLAADALGISTRYIIQFNAEALARELKLGKGDYGLCLMPLGKR